MLRKLALACALLMIASAAAPALEAKTKRAKQKKLKRLKQRKAKTFKARRP